MERYSRVALIILVFVFVYYLYRGVTTVAWEGDSLAYHIPLARNILSGNFTTPMSWGEWYPGASEAILSFFMALNIPLNLYNLLAWVLLVWIVFKLGIHFGLTPALSLISAASVGTINSVVRLIPTQTIDIWLAVYYLWAIWLLENPKRSTSYFLKLGIAAGMIIGSKYSGPLFLLPLAAVYAKHLHRFINIKSAIAVLPIIFLGISWYLRNWVLTGDPIYPAHAADFKLLDWNLWKTNFFVAGGAFKIIEALVSEYLIWAIVPLLVLRSVNSRLKLLGFANLAICIFLPTWPENIISDLRYTYVAFIPLILCLFLWLKKQGLEEWVGIISLCAMISVLPQLDYHPKIFFVGMAFVLIFAIQHKRLLADPKI